jgi:pyruvate/2-oxoacid:ferredoxin oxidoreductase alpha subunit
MICGSIGYGNIDELKKFYGMLKNNGFDVLEHLSQSGMDYSDIKDFREKKDLASKIVKHDLEFITKADVIVVLAGTPSYGAAIEMEMAKKSGKKVILFAPKPVPTPWPVEFSDFVAKSKDELFEILCNLDPIKN